MTLVAVPSYDKDLSTFGHYPGGPRGSAVSAASRLAIKYGYRGAKRLGRYIFRPGTPTITKALRRGSSIGIGIGTALNLGEDDLDGQIPRSPIRKTPNRFQQRNYRQRGTNRSRRCYHRRRDCCTN